MSSERKVCRGCGGEPTPVRAALGDYSCAACRSAEARVRYLRRKAAGWTPKRTQPTAEQRSRYYAATYQRAKLNPERSARWTARKLARLAVRRGVLIRQPCEVCGAERVEAHHDDYSQPLNVRWLCPTHHREHHAAERARQAA